MMKLAFAASLLAYSNAISRESEWAGPAAALVDMGTKGGAAVDLMNAGAKAAVEAQNAINNAVDQGKKAGYLANAYAGQAQKFAQKAIDQIPAFQVDHTEEDNEASLQYLKSMDSVEGGDKDEALYKATAKTYENTPEARKQKAADEKAAKEWELREQQKKEKASIEDDHRHAMAAKRQSMLQMEQEKKSNQDSYDNFMKVEETAVDKADKFMEEQAEGREKLRLEAVAEMEGEEDDTEEKVPQETAALPPMQELRKAREELEALKESEEPKKTTMGNFHKKFSLAQTETHVGRESLATQECQCKKYGTMGSQVPEGVEKLCEIAAVTNGVRRNTDSDYCVEDMPGYRNGWSICTSGRQACLVPAAGL